ncbi:MAG: DNA polymerase III subunit delta' [Pseudomonadota bacterium]
MKQPVLESTVHFTDLLGQERARRILRLAVSSGRLPHAYLFCGIAGCGRRSAARMLAAALNCLSPRDSEACGECASCRKLARGTHPDYISLEPEAEATRKDGDQEDDKPLKASGRKGKEGGKKPEGAGSRKGLTIKMDQVRALCRRLSFGPTMAQVRVSVLWPAAAMGEEAANALLKTLEEPPPRNLLILCCREPGELLPTIASRCQAVSFRPLPDGVVSAWLVARKGVDAEQAARLAYLSGGSLTVADRLLDDRLPEWRQRLLACLLEPRQAAVSGTLALAESLAGDELRDALLEMLKGLLRDALVLATTGQGLHVANRDLMEPLATLATREGMAGLVRALEMIERAQLAIEANCGARLALEVMLLKLLPPKTGGRESHA